MKQELLEKFIRVRITNDDRYFIEQYILKSGLSISEVFRELLRELKSTTKNLEKK